MSWNNMPILGKLLMAFGIILSAMLANLLYSNYANEGIRHDAAGLIRVNDNSNALLKAEIAHHSWVNAISLYLLEDGQDTLNVVADGRQCAFGKWFYGPERRSLEERMPEIAAPLRALEDPHSRLHGSLAPIKAAVEKGDLALAKQLFNDQAIINLKRMQEVFKDVLEILNARTTLYSGNLLHRIDTSITVSLIVGLCVFLGGTGAAFFIARNISTPLKRLVRYAQDVATGNLRQPTLRRKDEVGKLSDALGDMVAILREKIEESQLQSATAHQSAEEAALAKQRAEAAQQTAVSQNEAMLGAARKIETVANSLSDAAARLSAQITQSEKGAKLQVVKIAETVTVIDKMNGIVLDVARNADSAEELSAQARRKAEDGENVVHEAVTSILTVQEQSHALRKDMQALDEHARAISRIMGVISDIADQTNLLALNAAIEAARAGDAGRGFAVVADEVRKLAEKTMTSTTDVGEAIKAIQESADKSMRQMDQAMESIGQATELANRSGLALREIVSMVEGASDQVRAITAISKEQTSSSNTISRAIGEVNTVAGEAAQAMFEAANAVNGLTEQSRILSSLVVDMKHS